MLWGISGFDACLLPLLPQAMLHRIQVSEPVYNRAKWEEDRAAQEKIIRGMSEFKPRSPSPDTARGGSAAGRGSRGSPLAAAADAPPDEEEEGADA